MSGAVLEAEIESQPAEVEAFLTRHLAPMRALARGLRSCAYALVAARGSSDHAATYARYVLGALGGLPVAPAAPSLHTLYGTPPRMTEALVVGISQSGQSPDVVSVVEAGRRAGRPTVAFTNDLNSPLARAAEHAFDLCTGPERSIAATKTYTTQLAGIALLAAALRGEEAHFEELRRLPEAMARTLSGVAQHARAAGATLADESTLLTLARGVNLCTAEELALKLRELLRVFCQGFSAADFRHGSIALVSRGLPLLLVMPRGVGFADMQALAEAVTERGARLLTIGNEDATLPVAEVPEWLSPLVTVLAGQRLALESARARGLDPDRPVGLAAKVVKTT
jgi:glucosamine--fructose-6-phosphate aminotransferase (isomerizing)